MINSCFIEFIFLIINSTLNFVKLLFGMPSFLREDPILLFEIVLIIFLNEEDNVIFQCWKHTNLRVDFELLEMFITFDKSLLKLLNLRSSKLQKFVEIQRLIDQKN